MIMMMDCVWLAGVHPHGGDLGLHMGEVILMGFLPDTIL